MVKRIKSTSEDEIIIYDETADVVERLNAIGRLAFDGYYEMQPLLEKLLNHQNNFLRAEAIKVLLGRWEIDKFLDQAINLLHNDPNWDVRGDAAFSLSEYLKYSNKEDKIKHKILKALLFSLLNDSHQAVQRKCFEKSYEIITGEHTHFQSSFFDRNKDVNWKILQPYLEKYNLQEPT